MSAYVCCVEDCQSYLLAELQYRCAAALLQVSQLLLQVCL
jgi:hypothetical protein